MIHDFANNPFLTKEPYLYEIIERALPSCIFKKIGIDFFGISNNEIIIFCFVKIADVTFVNFSMFDVRLII